MDNYPLVGNRIQITENPKDVKKDRRKYNLLVDRGLFNLIAEKESWVRAEPREMLNRDDSSLDDGSGNPQIQDDSLDSNPKPRKRKRGVYFDRWRLDFDAALDENLDQDPYPLRGEGIEVREREKAQGDWGHYSIFVSSDLKAALVERPIADPEEIAHLTERVHRTVARIDNTLGRFEKQCILREWYRLKNRLRDHLQENPTAAEGVSRDQRILEQLDRCLLELEHKIDQMVIDGSWKKTARDGSCCPSKKSDAEDCICRRASYLGTLLEAKTSFPGLLDENGWVVLGYYATDFKAEAAAGDTHCPYKRDRS